MTLRQRSFRATTRPPVQPKAENSGLGHHFAFTIRKAHQSWYSGTRRSPILTVDSGEAEAVPGVGEVSVAAGCHAPKTGDERKGRSMSWFRDDPKVASLGKAVVEATLQRYGKKGLAPENLAATLLLHREPLDESEQSTRLAFPIMGRSLSTPAASSRFSIWSPPSSGWKRASSLPMRTSPAPCAT